MDIALLLVGVGELLIVGVGGAVLRYCIKIESRLTRVETLVGG